MFRGVVVAVMGEEKFLALVKCHVSRGNGYTYRIVSYRSKLAACVFGWYREHLIKSGILETLSIPLRQGRLIIFFRQPRLSSLLRFMVVRESITGAVYGIVFVTSTFASGTST
jgi:hypothetical protein